MAVKIIKRLTTLVITILPRTVCHCDLTYGGGSNLSVCQQKKNRHTAWRIPSSRQRLDSERLCLFMLALGTTDCFVVSLLATT
jgi:hypothetical protein